MKLVKCHIENFGKLSNFDFDFTDGLNSIKQANGWGKSTFATFIKAMFYGLPVTSKRNLDENERKKYAPWQGGNYGGNLVFVLQGKQYKIERFFGKNKAEDTFALIDMTTGKKSKDFTENIGVEIFALDEAAFERSSYIPQKALDSSINESIAQRLTNLIQGTTEDFDYEGALARLDKQRSFLSNNKKTGQIQNLGSQIDDKIGQIRDLEARGQALGDLQTRINEQDATIENLLQQQNQIKVQIKKYGKLQEKLANQKELVRLNQQVATTQTQIDAKQIILKHQPLNAAEQAVLANDYVAERYQILRNYFGAEVPSPATTQAVYQDVLRYNTLKSQTVNPASYQAQPRQHKRWLSLGLVGLAILAVLGGVMLLQSQLIFAVILMIVGGGALLGAGYLSLVHLINVKTTVAQQPGNQRAEQDQVDLKQLQQSIVAFLQQYEKGATDYLAAINNVIANLREFGNVQSQIERDLVVLQNRLVDEKQALEKFQTEKQFNQNDAVSDVDIDGLQQSDNDLQMQINECRDSKAQLVARVNAINNELAGLNDLENEKENLQSELKTLEQDFAAIKNAMQFLQVANESLSSKFLEPMKVSVKQYLTKLTKQEFDNLNLDTDFNIAFEEYGKLREVDYYSKGYQNLIDLCLRFALVDRLYQQEKPFIILDDPFINLDESKVASAKQFLQVLAKDHQLIYFSCHQSRC